LIDPGSVAIGALCMLVLIVALVCVAIWYVASGVRVKLDGLRFVDRGERLPLPMPPIGKPSDFYDEAHERGDE
jgi:hypothetical protein